VIVAKNELRNIVAVALMAAFPLLGHAVNNGTVKSPVQLSNEAVARAYKSAADRFVGELKEREQPEVGGAAKHMAFFSSYNASVRTESDGFCIVFAPVQFEGRPIYGGVTNYCFDSKGETLLRTVRAK
jgi:hypothetical protein